MAVLCRVGQTVAMAIRVLIVDDTKDVRDMLRLLCEMEDDFVVAGEAANGNEAVEAAGRLVPDVVLLDWQMPGRDGLSALPEIRRAAPSSRIVMYSARLPSDAEPVALAAGADAYFEKTTVFEELIDRIRALVP